MNKIIPEAHKESILQALQIKASIEEKQKLSIGNIEAIGKLKDTTLEAYTDYRNLKRKFNMAMTLIDMFKD
ncbi:hypothetical protein QE109_11465 [Fusibacter bizertensis]|uniref:Uncharacterized protein n=1 Tax=Fusibacter bizertensis TaxID=1488331 RepID=A0ABT6NEE0_9FIRM|nr:hypothetical protein [Fusibacter bizertensis]MDH8678771.1 hypothetical protein [Fusibacter bizertensis]